MDEHLEEIREQSRTKILEGALRLFVRHGYAATSVRMIAEEAGVSQGLLYNYFDGKEGLLRSIFERSMEDVRESFERTSGGETPRDRLERLVFAAFDIVRSKLPFWRLAYQLRMQSDVLGGLEPYVREWPESIRLHLEELLRAIGVASPALEARLLFAAIDGAAQHYAIDPERYPLEEVAGALVRRFLPATAGAPGGLTQEAGS